MTHLTTRETDYLWAARTLTESRSRRLPVITGSHGRPAPARALACLLLLAAFVLWPSSSAVAHAEKVGSSPRDGATVNSPLREVSVDLNEDVREPAYVVVTDSSGKRVNSETASVSGKRVTSRIEAGMEPGEYTMSYRIVSVDAHPVSGSLRFTVSSSGATEAPAAPQPSNTQTSPSAGLPSSQVPIPDSNGFDGAYIVVIFFFVAMLVLVGILRAGLKSREGE